MIQLLVPVTTRWSGGTTTQLFISPVESTVEGRDFDIRISTATVEVDESVFTPFQGYLRKLMLLNGRMEIQHDSDIPLQLSPGKLHAFSGDSATHSKGQVQDFNVIHKPWIEPEIKRVILPIGQHTLGQHNKYCVLYFLSGSACVEDVKFNRGDAAVISEGSGIIEFIESCEVIQVVF